MILLIVTTTGLALLLGIAVAVGYLEAHQAAVWREIATERRRRWEEKQESPDGDE
jgi:hypothetical protein